MTIESKKITREQAEAEVTAWLDKKKIFQSTRERLEDNVELLIDAIQEGTLVLNQDDWKFTHTLLHPFGSDESAKITSLVYRSRLNDKLLKPCVQGVKANDADGRLLAYIAALTDQSRGLLESMDSVDKKIAMAIAVFFL